MRKSYIILSLKYCDSSTSSITIKYYSSFSQLVYTVLNKWYTFFNYIYNGIHHTKYITQKSEVSQRFKHFILQSFTGSPIYGYNTIHSFDANTGKVREPLSQYVACNYMGTHVNCHFCKYIPLCEGYHTPSPSQLYPEIRNMKWEGNSSNDKINSTKDRHKYQFRMRNLKIRLKKEMYGVSRGGSWNPVEYSNHVFWGGELYFRKCTYEI